jgi:hypothetical protein
VEFAWPGGGGIGVSVASDTPFANDVDITLTRVTCSDCVTICEGVAATDFYTSVGGAFTYCAYAVQSTDNRVAVLDSDFHDCDADYGV